MSSMLAMPSYLVASSGMASPCGKAQQRSRSRVVDALPDRKFARLRWPNWSLPNSPHSRHTILARLAQAPHLHSLSRLLLRHDFPGIELNQHSPVRLNFLDRDAQSEIVQKQELQLEMVQFGKWKAANL